jgi:hypothetical protein
VKKKHRWYSETDEWNKMARKDCKEQRRITSKLLNLTDKCEKREEMMITKPKGRKKEWERRRTQRNHGRKNED